MGDFINLADTHLQSLYSSLQTSCYQISGMICLENQTSHETFVVSQNGHHMMETENI